MLPGEKTALARRLAAMSDAEQEAFWRGVGEWQAKEKVRFAPLQAAQNAWGGAAAAHGAKMKLAKALAMYKGAKRADKLAAEERVLKSQGATKKLIAAIGAYYAALDVHEAAHGEEERATAKNALYAAAQARAAPAARHPVDGGGSAAQEGGG